MQPDPPSDSQLLADWLDRRQDPAFRELVSRYAGLVHMAALRVAGDDALAADAAQLTFILLARKARSLAGRSSLAGWLHHTAVWQAKDLLRKARREARKREHFQAAMDADPSPSETWHELSPFLDDALAALSEKDREALLLRFYRALSVHEVAAVLGIAGEAARKRIDRALDRLRGNLARRGVVPGVSLGAVMLAGFANDAQAAGAMVPALTAKALAAGGGGAVAVPMSLAAKAACVALPASVLLGGGVWLAGQYRAIANLEEQNTRLEHAVAANHPDRREIASASLISNPLARIPVDWAAVAAELKKDENELLLTNAGQIMTELRLAERDTLVSWLDEIDRANLSHVDHKTLLSAIAYSLMLSDPGYVCHRFLPRIRDGWEDAVSMSLALWGQAAPKEAIDWWQTTPCEHGAIPFSLGSSLFYSLISTDPAEADRLLKTQSEADRIKLITDGLKGNDPWRIYSMDERNHSAFAGLIRRNLPAADQAKALSLPLVMLDDGGPMINGPGDVEDYLDHINATMKEQVACRLVVAERGTFPRESGNRADTRPWDLATLRAWFSTNAPQQTDVASGKALAGALATCGEGNWRQVVDLARSYSEDPGADVVFDVMLESYGSWHSLRGSAAARPIIALLKDESLRAKYLQKVENIE